MTNPDARLRAEEAARELEALHRAVASQLPGGAVFVVGPDLRYRLADGHALAAAGTTREAIEGRSVAEVVPPPFTSQVVADYRGALEGTPFQREHQVGGRDFLTRGGPLRDATGRITAAVAVSYDVTDRKRMEDALQARERELQIVADTMPDILARFDRDLRHVFVNAAAARVSGLPREYFLGRTNRELGMPELLCDLWDGALRQAFERKEHGQIEFVFDTPRGPRTFLGRVAPEVEADGSVGHVVAIVTDVTELREAEHFQRDANRRKDEFLATLAHEWRNHLAPIRNSLGLLHRLGLATDAAARPIGVLDRQVEQLMRLADDLLDVASIGQGKVRLAIGELDLRQAIDTAIEASRPALDAQRHALSVQYPQEGVAVRADRARVVQVFANLLNNAAKYTPAGGSVEVTVDREEGWAVVHVADNGLGIPKAMLPKVFDLFVQVPAHHAQAQGGVGIGLSLVRRLVELHGGHVEVHSEGEGQGATFTVRLPLPGDSAAPHAD